MCWQELPPGQARELAAEGGGSAHTRRHEPAGGGAAGRIPVGARVPEGGHPEPPESKRSAASRRAARALGLTFLKTIVDEGFSNMIPNYFAANSAQCPPIYFALVYHYDCSRPRRQRCWSSCAWRPL